MGGTNRRGVRSEPLVIQLPLRSRYLDTLGPTVSSPFIHLPGFEFDWPCLFVPATRDDAPEAILGLTGLAHDFTLTYDTTYRPGAPYGILSLALRPDHRGRRVRL